MKILSTKIHGALDYIMGIMLIASPWIFGFATNGWETWIPVLLGMSVIVYSLMTDYELGLSDNISMRTHIIADIVSGVILAASPWIFGFATEVYLPHLIMGVVEILAASLTVANAPTHGMVRHARTHHHVAAGSSRRTAHG